MLMHTREGTTIVTQQEKAKNETRQQIYFKGSSLFDPFCCLESIYLFATGSSHFRTGQAKMSQAHFYSIHFLKVQHFPGKINRFLEFFLKLLFHYNRLSKQSFVRFLYGAGPLATLSRTWPLRGQQSLPRSLRNSLNSIPGGFNGFSGALSSFSHFSWL